MREILFRGKTEEGEWVQGYLVYWQSQICIQSILDLPQSMENPCGGIDIQYYPVIPETVGQKINCLSRKVGKDIFVGDKITFDLIEALGEPRINNCKEVIKSVECSFIYYTNVRLIGNIHDKKDK